MHSLTRWTDPVPFTLSQTSLITHLESLHKTPSHRALPEKNVFQVMLQEVHILIATSFLMSERKRVNAILL